MQSFDLENFLPYKLSIASQAISGLIANEYESLFGLTMVQWRILVIISNHTPLSASRICSLSLMDKMTVSRGLKALKNRNIIISTASTDDARKNTILLTETGKQIYSEIIPIARKYEERLLNLLTDSQKGTFFDVIKILTHGVEEIT